MAEIDSAKIHGFDLNSVCWGYREVFAKTIEGLFARGYIGTEKREVTERLFDVLRRSERNLFDHVLKEFLDALSEDTAWILDLPAIFDELVTLGCEFSDSKLYFGIQYFRILGDGGFGKTPPQVHALFGWLRRLKAVDVELAFSFLKGYAVLLDRLTLAEIESYIREGLRAYSRSRKTGYRFMETELASSETVIQELSRESRLEDEKAVLERLLKALTGIRLEVGDLSMLDSDELIERGSGTVCLYRWIYLPSRIREFGSRSANRRWYLLQAVSAAASFEASSFTTVHGSKGYSSLRDLVTGPEGAVNLVLIVEYVRITSRVIAEWPGARGLMESGFMEEFRMAPARTPDELLLYRSVRTVFGGEPGSPAAAAIVRAAGESANIFQTAGMAADGLLDTVVSDVPGFGRTTLRAFSFLPDFLYPATVTSASMDDLVADMKRQAARSAPQEDDGEPVSSDDGDADAEGSEGGESEEDGKIKAAYLYDEWSSEENDYYRDYCMVHESGSRREVPDGLPPEYEAEVERIRRIFEMLKPVLVHKVKYLADGDDINADLLLDFLVAKRKDPSPPIRFYEKPYIEKRDLSVTILLDVSGSTDETVGTRRVIDIEKHAALILGQGLESLGDSFSICGFSGNGREDCRYLVFKDFEEPWTRESMAGVLAARPMSSTRIGAALRHTGYRMVSLEARQKLIILITDGRPMDQAYDPGTRYAQHDVRMACEENRRDGVFTFCISTMENSRSDMEIMFPGRRFVILEDISDLPKVLPGLYIKMTV